MASSPNQESLSRSLPIDYAEEAHRTSSYDYTREPEYDGPEAPPVFVVLESDLASHELRNSTKTSNLKKINPIKNLPRKGASTIRTKFFEEKDSARLSGISRKLGRSAKERKHKKDGRGSHGSAGDLLALEVSMTESACAPEPSPREEHSEDATPFFAGSEDDGELDPMLYSLELDEEMLSPRNAHAVIGKKFTSIRREALRQSGRASNYLKQMPKTVAQDFKEAVNTDNRSHSTSEIELPISRSPHDRDGSSMSGGSKISRKSRTTRGLDLIDLQEAVAAIGILQQNLPDILLSALENTRKQDSESMQQFTQAQLSPLQEQNQILTERLGQLNETNQRTQLLLESMTKKMEVLEQRITAVQKSQVNQITLFDFLFYVLNALVLGFATVMGWLGISKSAKKSAGTREVKGEIEENSLTLSEIVKKSKKSS